MRKLVLTMLAVMAMSVAAQAKTVKTSFKVDGMCDMCEARIEKAAKSCKGVLSASWSQKTRQLTLVYDNAKTTPAKVQKAIAAAGHDAGSVKASNAAYNKLPSCCRYRSGSMKNCH
ncbi:MAG: heavy-metal-associated domain-containing protein [Prevotella sp.]|nr:cation transporter [Bacteroidales bacterium]MDY4228362.1 heavy-metal-associated domain-containing protein [Prevotella sp.]MCI6102824.1 cation transporter [Bacteroidales bacterium]MCI7597279.1 cation transporter [Bacteroidales bacterium]MCI7654513.1 cation transporter [Bacteroidales bacterium]